ncbi:MAG: radical SAM family heme chaperone HemW [Cyanophyceae cyanobacterium]
MSTIISLPVSAVRPVISPVPRAVYLHIPFCRRRCHYCDFAIAVTGEFVPHKTGGSPSKTPVDGSNSDRIRRYVDTLTQEITQDIIAAPLTDQPNSPLSKSPPLTTIFFGGGTPSLLSVEQFRRILQALKARFTLAPTVEISMEMDPGTFNREKLAGFLDLGLNRVSLGVQAFQDELLEACGRLHRRHEVDRAIAMLDDFGITNWSLDLITGLPYQTEDHWRESLALAIAANPAHISVYDLTVEPGTVFGYRYEPGEFPLPPEAIATELYRHAHKTLTATGYDHYEISNYAKPGHRSRHNLVYWRNEPYYAFGMAATSYVDRSRFSRPPTPYDYENWVNEGGEMAGEQVDPVDEWLETLMVGLRLSDGLLGKDLAKKFGSDPVQELVRLLQPYEKQGLVTLTKGAIALTSPDGFLVSNNVLSTIFERWMDVSHL